MSALTPEALIPEGTVFERLLAADSAPWPPVAAFVLLTRDDVHTLAVQLGDDADTIARLRADLEQATR